MLFFNKKLVSVFFFSFLLQFSSLFSQPTFESIDPIVHLMGTSSHIPPTNDPGTIPQSSTIQIIYFPNLQDQLFWEQPMKDAFEYAANLWTQTITSSVPIVIHARLRKTSESLATTNTYYSRNFVNAPLQNVDYPCALANSFAGEDTRTEVPDMDITVSTNEALQSWDDDVKGVWYLGTDGLTNSYDPFEGPQYDFVTVMFHEIGHGLLGSTSTTPVTFTNGVPYSQTLLNTIFNQFIGNCASGTLMTEMQSPSATIGYMVSGYPIVLNNGDVIYNYPCWLGSGDPPCDFNLKI